MPVSHKIKGSKDAKADAHVHENSTKSPKKSELAGAVFGGSLPAILRIAAIVRLG